MIHRLIKKCYYLLLRIFLSKVDYAKKIGVTIKGKTHYFGSVDFGSEPWLVTIGDRVRTSSGIKFVTHDGGTWVFRNQLRYKNVIKYGAIEVKDNCFIGANVIVMPGVTIGPNAVVGAGSVVTKDVPEGMVYAGNPAKPICTVEEYAEKCLRELPKYDEKAYKENKKAEVKKMLNLK